LLGLCSLPLGLYHLLKVFLFPVPLSQILDFIFYLCFIRIHSVYKLDHSEHTFEGFISCSLLPQFLPSAAAHILHLALSSLPTQEHSVTFLYKSCSICLLLNPQCFLHYTHLELSYKFSF
jgi:hypothetical protein